MARVYLVVSTVGVPLPPRAKLSCAHITERTLLCGTTHGSLFLVDATTSALQKVVTLADKFQAVVRVVTSPSGKFVAAALSGGTVVVHNLHMERRVMTHDLHAGATVTALVWSGGGSFFVSGDDRGRVVLCTLGGYSTLTNEARVVATCGSPVVQVACRDRLLLVSTTTGCITYNIASTSVTSIGSQPRTGAFGVCFLPSSLTNALRPLLAAGAAAEAGITPRVPPPGGATPITSPPPRHQGTPSALATGGSDATTGYRRSRVSPSPSKGMPPAGTLVLCARPSCRLWVADAHTGRVLCTLKAGAPVGLLSPVRVARMGAAADTAVPTGVLLSYTPAAQRNNVVLVDLHPEHGMAGRAGVTLRGAVVDHAWVGGTHVFLHGGASQDGTSSGSLYGRVIQRHQHRQSRRPHARRSRRRRHTKCKVHAHCTFPSCLSSRTACGEAFDLPADAEYGLTRVRTVTAREFLVRVGGASVAAQMQAAVDHNVEDVEALTALCVAMSEVLGEEGGGEGEGEAEAEAEEEDPGTPSKSFVTVSGPPSVVSLPTPDTSQSSGRRTPDEWVVLSAESSPASGKAAPSDAPLRYVGMEAPVGKPTPELTPALRHAFFELCRGVGVGGDASVSLSHPAATADDYVFHDEEDDDLLSPAWSSRAAVLRQGDRLSGMFESLRNSLSALRAARGAAPTPGSATPDTTSSSPAADVRRLMPFRSPVTPPLKPQAARLAPPIPLGFDDEDMVVGTAMESVPSHILGSIRASLMASRTPPLGFAVMAAHVTDLSNLPLPLVSHDAVTEQQALKDADRDQVEVNGVLQPPGHAADTLAAITALIATHVGDSDVAANAAVNVLKSGSRTSTGGDSFFAVQALLREAVITPTRGPDGAGPVVVCVGVDGHVSIQADNVFDVYLPDDFGGAPATPGVTPQPWLRLRVIITEEGSIVYTERRRRLTILALPPLGDDSVSPVLAALATPAGRARHAVSPSLTPLTPPVAPMASL